MATKKARKVRSDMQIGNLEKKLGLPEGTIRNEDGRNTRSDKLVGTVRKEAAKKSSKSSKKR
jgi:hypothetical protein